MPCSRRAAPGVPSRVFVATVSKTVAEASVVVPVARTLPVYSVVSSVTRAVSPLRRADDAVELDTSDLTLAQVLAALTEMVQQRIGVQR